MNYNDLIQKINKDLAIVLPDHISLNELQKILATHINLLIENDFDKLISILYRVDVNELKLKHLLSAHPGDDAGKMIAELIIERQLQKIKTRQQFSQRDDNFTEEERW